MEIIKEQHVLLLPNSVKLSLSDPKTEKERKNYPHKSQQSSDISFDRNTGTVVFNKSIISF